MSSNVDIIISKVRRDLSKYDDAGLIDDNELYNDAVHAMKAFGNDLCERHEAVIEVKNGFAKLPENFFSLYLAVKCEPFYYTKETVDEKTLHSSLFYKERVELSSTWNECQDCPQQFTEKIIKENIYYDNVGSKLTFHYHNPILLRLMPGVERSACAKDCRNSFNISSPYEINIVRRGTLQTNFDEGTIYLQFNGLPVDEEGHLDIPETDNGFLQTYIEYYLKRRLAEQLIANGDAQGLQNLFQTYIQQEQLFLRKAGNELKFKKLDTKNLRRKMVRYNRLTSLQYEIKTNF